MANIKLEAKFRSDLSKSHVKQLRRAGFVTASVFGHDTESVSLEVNLKELVDKVKESPAGIMTLFDVKIDGAPTKVDGTIIIKEFFKDPLTRRVLDIQFQRVSMTEKLHVSVPIELLGEPAGLKEGGILEQILNDLDIKSFPGDIPAKVEIDISGLTIGRHVRAGDITLGAGIELLTDAEAMVCTVVPPHIRKGEEEEAEAVETPAAEAQAQA